MPGESSLKLNYKIPCKKFAIALFAKIYELEKEAKKSGDRKAYRLKHIKPIFEELIEWINKEVLVVLPKSAIGKAMTYTINQWPKLISVLDYGNVELDNNLIENKVRPLAPWEENYLFAGNHAAAQRIAMMYSFFATCDANDVNPYKWLKHTLEQIQFTKPSQLKNLLPNQYCEIS